MEGDPNMYALAKWMFDAALSTDHLGWWTKPFLAIFLLFKFMNWVYRTSRGERLDSLNDAGVEAAAGLENRMRYGRNYHTLRNEHGLSNRELRDIGRRRF